MIPEELTIEGFYSYQKPQTISFTKLLQDKLFGIFGKVGSGKSSILEAMTLALYGETERLNNSEKRNYNIMNLKSNKLKIDFIFRTKNKRYKFEVNGKRNPKEKEKVTLNYKHFQEINGEWSPLKDSIETEKILGLNYDNFKRTVIIPQGKFQEFLTLKPSERTEMMKELFSLHQFDLSDKAKKHAEEVSEKLATIEGQLSEIGNPSKEEVEKLEQDLKELEKEIGILQEKQNELQKKITEQENLQASLQKITELNNQLNNLLKESTKIHSLEKEQKEWEVYKNVFLEIYINYSKTRIKIQELENEIGCIEKELKELKSKEPEIQAEFKKKEKRLKEKEKYSKKLDDWSSLKTLLSLEIEWNKQQEKQKEVEAKKKHLSDQILDLKKNLISKKETLNSFWEKQKEFTQLLTRKAELSELNRNLKDYESLKQDKLKQEEKFSEMKHLFEIKLKELLGEENPSFSISEYIEKTNQQVLHIKEELENLKILSSLKLLSKDLKIGDTCPLCGERIQNQQHLEKNLQSQNQTEELELELNRLQKLQTKLQILEREYETETKNYLEKRSEIQSKMQTLEPKLPKKSELQELQTVESKLKQQGQVQLQITTIEKEISQLEKDIESKEKILNQKTEQFVNFQVESSALESKIQTLREKIFQEVFEKTKNFSIKKIEERIKLQSQILERIPIQYEQIAKQKQDLDKKISSLQSLLVEKNKEKEKELHQHVTQKQKLENLFTIHKNFNLEKIEQLYTQNIQLDEIRKKISNYYEEKKSLENRLIEEQDKIKSHENQISELPSWKEKLYEITAKLNQSLEKKGNFQSNWERLKKSLERKSELEQERNRLRDKLERVMTLQGLFKGNGFVNYISKIFLEDLCESANERFFVFTRNSLRLELNENGDIHIRDYLNDGNLRHVKTLSGGQLFQASLAMALALSDRIQRSLGVHESFFFLDEGFGSLDKESLEIVFETLKSLKRENRIVGLISHVEEMKAEIRTFLLVENHNEHSSIVKVN